MSEHYRGIIYITTTTVPGLIKIGKTRSDSYQERMRFLEGNGYRNVTGLKRFFAIELDDYNDKESLIHEVFSKHRVGDTELFALDQELVRQLLLSFEGTIIYPEGINKESEFDAVTEVRKQSALFSFYQKGIANGDTISFTSDPSITAVVVGEREVEYEGQVWKLSPLTYRIFAEKDSLNKSGAYQGAAYWSFNGARLKDISI